MEVCFLGNQLLYTNGRTEDINHPDIILTVSMNALLIPRGFSERGPFLWSFVHDATVSDVKRPTSPRKGFRFLDDFFTFPMCFNIARNLDNPLELFKVLFTLEISFNSSDGNISYMPRRNIDIWFQQW